MSGNFTCIPDTLTIRGAMSELVRQAGEHDNISTLYVVDGSGVFSGAIDLKDLIVARENDPLEGIICRSYPYVLALEKVEDCIDQIAEYEEDSLPVLTDDGKIAGILTAQDLMELVDDAMGDDYAKLGGLTAEEALREPAITSMKKRLPWLAALLFLVNMFRIWAQKHGRSNDLPCFWHTGALQTGSLQSRDPQCGYALCAGVF